MQAPYEGKLDWVDVPRGGVSQNTGNEWKSVDFALKYIDHQMQEQIIVFTASGVERVNRLTSLPLGTAIRVTWRPGGRKYTNQSGETKYFAQIEALGISIITQQQPPLDQNQAQAPAPTPAPAPQYPQPNTAPYGGQYPNQRPQAVPQYPTQAPQYPTQAAPQYPAAPAAPTSREDDLPF